MLTLEQTAAVSLFSFVAGFVDSIVGGGGLIQLPALFIFLPAAPVPLIFGTNKLASIAGTSVAMVRYSSSVGIQWRRVLPGAVCAALFSSLGAYTLKLVSQATRAYFRPVVLFLLIGVALYTFTTKSFGARAGEKLFGDRERWISLAIGAGIGFYDGFFGPGTGSFLIFLFVGFFGLTFLEASAEAKVVNFATNLAAVTYFAATRNILYELALPMAACNILGALAGTRLAVARGNRLVRTLFLLVIAAVIARFGYDTLGPLIRGRAP